MKWILAIVLLALMVVGGVWLSKRHHTETQEEGMTVYADPEGVFSFEYPREFKVSGREGPVLAKVEVPRSYMPSTNFSDAELAINWESGGTDSSCNGSSTTNEAATGNLYETTTRKKLYDGDCYTFVYTIHSTNIGNYDPNDGIQEFDKNKIKDDLEGIIDSFKYLVNSD